MATEPIFIGCDHDVTYAGASAAGAYQNAGTCGWELKLATAPFTSLGTGSLAYVAASNGDYAGTIESTVTDNVAEGSEYHVIITFSQGSNNDKRRLLREGTYREEF